MKKKKPAPRKMVNVTDKIKSRKGRVVRLVQPGSSIMFSEGRNLGYRPTNA